MGPRQSRRCQPPGVVSPVHLIRRPLRNVLLQLAKTLRKQAQLPAQHAGPLLDSNMTLFAGDLAVVAAPRQEETETLLLTIGLDEAVNRDVLFVVEQPEQTELRLLSLATGIELEAIESLRLTDIQLASLRVARDRIGSQPIELMRTARLRNNIVDLKRWLESHHGGLAVIPAAWPTSLLEDSEHAGGFVRMLKAMARETDSSIMIPWWLRARIERDSELRDLQGAGAAEEDTDLVILVHHDAVGDIDEIRIAKNRHGECRVLWPAAERDFIAGSLPGPLDA